MNGLRNMHSLRGKQQGLESQQSLSSLRQLSWRQQSCTALWRLQKVRKEQDGH